MSILNPKMAATASPTAVDIGVLAGFLLGEGTFRRKHSHEHGIGTERISAPQGEQEPLLRLKKFFGGTVRLQQNGRPRVKPTWRTANGIYIWEVYGPRARGVMMTVYKFMSPQRKQEIKTALRL